MDEIMADAFSSTPTSLDQCVGGVAVVVTPTQELVRGWGATALNGDITPDAATLFQIGSISKVFTGLGAARLVEEGVFSGDTSIGTLLNTDLNSAALSWPTLGALLTHRSGLPQRPGNLVDRDGNGSIDPDIDLRSPATGYNRNHLRAALSGWAAPTKTSYLYSDLGIGLVALGLQDHLGLTNYHATLSQLVTGTLGMNETWGEVVAIPSAARERLATPYELKVDKRVPGIVGQMGVLAGAGEIVTTGDDMRRFLRAMTGHDVTALAPAITRATEPLAAGPGATPLWDMGYAIQIQTDADGRKIYVKGGETTGYTAYVQWSTNPRAGVAVMTNCGAFKRVVSLAGALHELSVAN